MSGPPDRLLGFLAPGLVHGLNNALFAIAAQAKLIGRGEPARSRDAILRAIGGASASVEILALLAEVGGSPPRQAGVLLRELCELLRLPCRDHDLRLEAGHSSVDCPVGVAAGGFCRAVVEAVRCLCALLPVGYRGVLRIDLAAQRRERIDVVIGLAADPNRLPFRIDLQRAAAEVAAHLGDGIAVAPLDGDRLTLSLPTAAAAAEGTLAPALGG